MAAEGLLRSSFVALVCVVACAGEEPRPIAPNVAPPESAVREHWPRFTEVASWPPVNTTPFPTRGHLVKPSHALVRVSAEARAPYLGLVTDSVLPDGTVIAMFHESRDGAKKGAVYVMEKKGNDWSFLALDSEGGKTSENLDVCALCHRGGVADHVFGLPRSQTMPAPAE